MPRTEISRRSWVGVLTALGHSPVQRPALAGGRELPQHFSAPIYTSSIAARAPWLGHDGTYTHDFGSTSPLSSYPSECSATPRPLRPQLPRPIRVIPGLAVFSPLPSYRLTSFPSKSLPFGQNLITLFADLLH